MPPAAFEDAVVVVGRHDLGESDRIVRLVTREHGRVDVVARGARRSRKRFAGALDPGTRAIARWQRGRGDLGTLVELSEVRLPRRAREDWSRLALMTYGCELVAALAGPAPEPRLHRLLEAWLDVLEGEGTPGDASRVALEAKALTFAGLTPSLVRCARSGEALDATARWDHDAGGGVLGRFGQGPAVDPEHLAAIDRLRRTPVAQTTDLTLPRPVRWLLSDFVRYQTGSPLKSRASLSVEEVHP